MPLRIVDATERPTFVEHPNVRFATSALSHEYRDYAVNGELIMDKINGELLIKRPADGRIVSYDQNKRYMHDLMLELRVLLTTNENFLYPGRKVDIDSGEYTPEEEDEEYANRRALFIDTNYDLVAINNEHPLDVLMSANTVIPEKSDDVDLRNTLSFNISGKTNGFFCKPVTRNSDRAVVDIFSRIYNNIIIDYNDDEHPSIQNEYRNRFFVQSAGNKFSDSDVILSYKVVITNDGRTTTYPSTGYYTDFLRFNEKRCVQFPDSLMTNFPDGFESATVIIGSLEYYKMHYVVNNVPGIPELDNILEELQEYMSPDGKVYVNYFHVGSFVDKYSDIELLGNDYLIACVDVPYLHRYMQKMASLRQSATFIQSSLRPDDIDWGSNAVWAETVKNVEYNGNIVNKNSATDIKELETYIAKMNRTMLNFTSEEINTTDIWVKPL